MCSCTDIYPSLPTIGALGACASVGHSLSNLCRQCLWGPLFLQLVQAMSVPLGATDAMVGLCVWGEVGQLEKTDRAFWNTALRASYLHGDFETREVVIIQEAHPSLNSLMMFHGGEEGAHEAA